MPIRDEYTRLPLAAIHVEREARQRREVEIDSLKSSIQARGVMNPIIVRRLHVNGEMQCWLVAGERRLEASRALNLPDIPVRFADELSHLEMQIIELEENVKRRDLAWQDLVDGFLKVHEAYSEKNGEGWGSAKTAEECGITQRNLDRMLVVARTLREESTSGKGDTKNCPNWTSAYERIMRLRSRASADAIMELMDDDEDDDIFIPPTPTPGAGVVGGGGAAKGGFGPLIGLPRVKLDDKGKPVTSISNAAPRPKAEEILCEDFAEWAKTYAGPKFNFLHCDFPYGVEVFKSGLNRTGVTASGFEYEDAPETFDKLLNALFENAKNILSGSCHVMFWMPARHERIVQVIQKFNTHLPAFDFIPFPLIWHKSDNAGMFSNPDKWPRLTYEVALLAHSGGRKVVQQVAASFSGPTNNTVHPSCKPSPMLHHFFRMLVDGSTRLLDPTCGSGTSIAVADGLGAQQVLGLEVDKAMAQTARLALKAERERRAMKDKEIDL